MNPDNHIDYLDSFLKENKNLAKIGILYEDLKNIDLEIRSTQKKIENASTRKELLDFQINEIESIDPKKDEDLSLSKEFKRLKNIEDTISTLKNINLTYWLHYWFNLLYIIIQMDSFQHFIRMGK